MNNYAVILAAGSGRRMESHDLSKCFIKVNDKEIFKYSLETFLDLKQIRHVVLVVPFDFVDLISFEYSENDRVSVICGGATRQESVYNALCYLKSMACDDDNILIHDSARPLVSKNIILNNIEECSKNGACLTAIKSIDTIVKTNDFVSVSEIPERNGLYAEQTPATFKYSLILSAHETALTFNTIDSSDDCSLVMKLGEKISLVPGERNNFKITNEIDLALFKTIIDNNAFIN